MEIKDRQSADAQDGNHRSVFKNLGKIIGAVTALVLIIFLVQVFGYYRTIKNGATPALPQFSSKLTLGKSHPVRLKSNPMLFSQDDPSLGSENPLITIVEFADFECEHSREEFSVVREMAEKYKDKVRFVYRDYPLMDVHPHAKRAAIAGICAERQNKFWQMHDKMYLSADALSDADLMRYAQESGLNMADFSSCFLSAESEKEVDNDLADGAALGVVGTPTFFINGTKVEGAIPRDIFDKIIKTMMPEQN